MKMYKSFTALINFIFTLASRKRSKLNEIKNAFSYLATPLTVRPCVSQQVNKHPTTIYASSNWKGGTGGGQQTWQQFHFICLHILINPKSHTKLSAIFRAAGGRKGRAKSLLNCY